MNTLVKPTKGGISKDLDYFDEDDKGFEVVEEDYVVKKKG